MSCDLLSVSCTYWIHLPVISSKHIDSSFVSDRRVLTSPKIHDQNCFIGKFLSTSSLINTIKRAVRGTYRAPTNSSHSGIRFHAFTLPESGWPRSNVSEAESKESIVPWDSQSLSRWLGQDWHSHKTVGSLKAKHANRYLKDLQKALHDLKNIGMTANKAREDSYHDKILTQREWVPSSYENSDLVSTRSNTASILKKVGWVRANISY